MKPRELISEFPLGPGDPRPGLLWLRLLLRYLADHARDAQLEDGRYLTDVTSVVTWHRQLAEEMRRLEGTKVLPMAENWTRPAAPPVAQPRWQFEDTCPRCGHVHQGESECGEQMGGGRICRCEFEIGVPV